MVSTPRPWSKAPLEAKDAKGDNPLHYACRLGPGLFLGRGVGVCWFGFGMFPLILTVLITDYNRRVTMIPGKVR